jgi:hypothetical protein
MRHWAIAITAVAIVALAVGCDSKNRQAADAPRASFDPATDPGLNPRQAKMDPDLLKPPSARPSTPAAATSAPAGPEAAPAKPAEQAVIDEVKPVMEQIRAAVQANPKEWPADLMIEADVAQLKRLPTLMTDIAAKANACREAGKAKNIPTPVDAPMLDAALQQLQPGKMLTLPDPGTTKYEQVGANIRVGEGDDTYTFCKTDKGWKLTLDDNDKQELSLVEELFAAVGNAFDVVTAGINGGSVTAANIAEKMDAALTQSAKPVVQKIEALEAKQGKS